MMVVKATPQTTPVRLRMPPIATITSSRTEKPTPKGCGLRKPMAWA